MDVLKMYFNGTINQCSPIQTDYQRVVSYDEDGNEIVTYAKVDYPKLQQSLGSASDWNLNALLKAGINPDFPIHTGNPTRLEGLNSLDDFAAAADAILNDTETKE